jgi:hypothetical protein
MYICINRLFIIILKGGDNIPFVLPEAIKKAKEMDVLTYLMNADPFELVRVTSGIYSTKTHDSLKISNGKWMWWSRGIGGKTAVDYLCKVKGMNFTDAVTAVLKVSDVTPAFITNNTIDKKRPFILPRASPNNDTAISYLEQRGIAKNIILWCIEKGIIYESIPRNAVVFVGNDEFGIPRYANVRGTGKDKFFCDSAGSDKQYSFRLITRDSTSLHLFEGAIDLLSYATLMQMQGQNWRGTNLVSLSGVYRPSSKKEFQKPPVVVNNFLENNKKIRKIYLHLDNDYAGKTATDVLIKTLTPQYKVINKPVPLGKDVNDFLLFTIQNSNERSIDALCQSTM